MHQLQSYLTLQDSLSQVWINKYTIISLLVIFKLIAFSFQVQKSLSSVENVMLGNGDLCYYYDLIANETPYYMSVMANYMIEKSIEETIEISLKILCEVILILQNVLIFMFDMWFGTYACLFVTAVGGAVDVATNVTESVISVANSSVHAVAKDLNYGLRDLSGLLNTVIADFEKIESKVESLFKSNTENSTTDMRSNITRLNLTVSKLSNFYINSDINENLKKLSSEVPDFQQVKNKTAQWIKIPFAKTIDKMQQVNVTQFTRPSNISLEPINFIKTLNRVGNNGTKSNIASSYEYCEEVILPEFKHFFSKFNKIVSNFQIIVIILILLFAMASCVPECFEELFMWRKLYKFRDSTNIIGSNVFDDKYDISKEPHVKPDILERYFAVFQSWEVSLLSKMSILSFLRYHPNEPVLQKNYKKTYRKRWAFHYIFSKRATLLLLISLTGFVCCLVQYIFICYLNKIVESANNDFSKNSSQKQSVVGIVQNMTSVMNSSFIDWSDHTNEYIGVVQDNLNNQLVIRSISEITETLNNTATNVLNEITFVINDFFNNTILQKPTMSIMNCVVGNKLQTLIKGLTWVHNEVRIDIPTLSRDQLHDIYNPMDISHPTESSSSSTTKFEAKLDDVFLKIIAELRKVIKYYKKSIKFELIISVSLFALWFTQIPAALLRLKYHYKAL